MNNEHTATSRLQLVNQLSSETQAFKRAISDDSFVQAKMINDQITQLVLQLNRWTIAESWVDADDCITPDE